MALPIISYKKEMNIVKSIQPRCYLRVFAESRRLSTLIGRSPWQPKATSKTKDIGFKIGTTPNMFFINENLWHSFNRLANTFF